MEWPIYIVVVGTVAVSSVLTWGARFLAPKLGLVDQPDGGRKKHAKATPLMGGVAIYCALLISVGLAQLLGGESLFEGSKSFSSMQMLLLSGWLFCMLGLVDDKWGMRARNKFLCQIAASLPFAVWGRSIESVEFASVNMHLGLLGVVFTVFWLVACSNIINLVDGLDGLAGTVSLVAALTVAALAVLTERYGMAVFSLVLAGSILGFLVHNWPPAKIFMGDSGSLTLGFLIGALAIETSLKKAAGFTLVVPLVLISIPIYDTLMAILRRKLTGRSIGRADRGHIHHRLQDRGLTRVQCLLTLAGLCLVMAAIAVVSAYSNSDILAVTLCASVLAILTAGRVFGHHEAALLFRHIHAVNTLLVDSLRALPSRTLLARMRIADDDDPTDFWEKLCHRVARMDGTNLEFRCVNGNEEHPIVALDWSNGEAEERRADSWQFRYSIRRNDRLQATMIAEGHTGESVRAQRVDDLFRLFDTFCRHWPIEELPSEAVIPDKLPSEQAVPSDSLLMEDYHREEQQGGEERRAA